MTDWIDVNDRLPIYKECILFFLKNGEYLLGVYVDDKKYPWICHVNGYDDFIPINVSNVSYSTDEVTHWQPLPEPPKCE